MSSGDRPVADIGHVHLKVVDLDRSVSFYRDLLGMEVKNVVDGAAFLAFGSYHHHWRSTHRESRPNPLRTDDRPLDLNELLAELD